MKEPKYKVGDVVWFTDEVEEEDMAKMTEDQVIKSGKILCCFNEYESCNSLSRGFEESQWIHYKIEGTSVGDHEEDLYPTKQALIESL